MKYKTLNATLLHMHGTHTLKWPEPMRKVQTEGRKTRNVNGTELPKKNHFFPTNSTFQRLLHTFAFYNLFFHSKNLVMKMRTVAISKDPKINDEFRVCLL